MNASIWKGIWSVSAGWQKCLAAVAISVGLLATSQAASAETRSLKLYFIHTKERAEIVYKRNGRYVQSGLNEINRFLRDWRRNEPAKMDPRLLDLVWSVYNSVGARDYIHVVSAYRSPATNGMLRSRSSGVAEKSQHMLGKAMDFYIPGVSLAKLRQAAFKHEGGGVGYYPKSGSPFVHLDVGNVRSWPRMSRGELMALFPDGRTIHLPSDGKPLAGYQQAMAAYKSRGGGAAVQMASAQESPRRRGLLSALFGGGADQDEDEGEVRAVASAPAARRQAPVAQPPAAAAPAPAPVIEQPAAAPTPEAIIAALPPREVPLPQLAPRPSVDVGAPAALTALAPVETAPSAAVEAATEVALNIPLPTRRPNYTPPVAVVGLPTANVPVPSAPAPVTASVAVAAVEPRPQVNAQDLIAALASEPKPVEPSATLAAYVPVPGNRPITSQGLALAAVPQADGETAADPLAAKLARVEARERTELLAKIAAAPAATPKAAIIARSAGIEPTAALAAGIRTTQKGAKPRADDSRPDRKTLQVPVQNEIARWALSRQPVTVNTAGTKAPSFAYDHVRSAPQVVYTAGFQPSGRSLPADRFSGKAVEFMSVARFSTN